MMRLAGQLIGLLLCLIVAVEAGIIPGLVALGVLALADRTGGSPR